MINYPTLLWHPDELCEKSGDGFRHLSYFFEQCFVGKRGGAREKNNNEKKRQTRPKKSANDKAAAAVKAHYVAAILTR